MGIECLEQVPDMDAIFVPVGGAGLIAGVSLALKTLKPDVQVIGKIIFYFNTFSPLFCMKIYC